MPVFYAFSFIDPIYNKYKILCALSFPLAGSWSMVATLVSCTIRPLHGKIGTAKYVMLHFSFLCSLTAILIIIFRRWSQATGVNTGNLPCRIFCRRCLLILLAFTVISICIPQIKPPIMSACLIFQASEKSAQAKKWAEPHIETAKTVVSHHSLTPICSCLLVPFDLPCTDNILTRLLSMVEEMGPC